MAKKLLLNMYLMAMRKPFNGQRNNIGVNVSKKVRRCLK